MITQKNFGNKNSQHGAALVTTMLISALLLTACVAMLSAVGASSKNTTDVLSETKAYYAAESGLQASINVLRNDSSATYSWAVSNPNLSPKLTYATVNGVSQVAVGSEAGYSIQVTDPDNTGASLTFNTSGNFLASNGALAGTKVCFPADCVSTPRTEITWTNASSTTYTFSGNYPSLGSFTVTKVGAGMPISTAVNFQIDYRLTLPRTATRTIRGTINTNSNASDPVSITFLTQTYELLGSSIHLSSSQNSVVTAAFTLANGTGPVTQSVPLYASMTAVEPYRLKVVSTGYGPSGSQKQLEGIIQKNFLNDLPSSSGLSMVGPGASLSFSPGNGNPTYCGVDPGIQPGQPIPNNPPCTVNPNEPTAPAIGVSDPAGLARVLAAAGNTAIVPAPAVITDGPDWQQTPTDLNTFLSQLRTTAQNTGRYVAAGNFQNVNTAVPYINSSEYTSGNGVTFCEGNCDIGPISGGGILVVTGNLNYNGNFNFRGLIIVAGPPGTCATRVGAGNGVILGNMVIAPYDPNNLPGGFGSPCFATSGGGNADLIFSGLSTNFDGTSAISNFMLGVAEK